MHHSLDQIKYDDKDDDGDDDDDDNNNDAGGGGDVMMTITITTTTTIMMMISGDIHHATGLTWTSNGICTKCDNNNALFRKDLSHLRTSLP